jgi:hypothetical protein
LRDGFRIAGGPGVTPGLVTGSQLVFIDDRSCSFLIWRQQANALVESISEFATNDDVMSAETVSDGLIA